MQLALTSSGNGRGCRWHSEPLQGAVIEFLDHGSLFYQAILKPPRVQVELFWATRDRAAAQAL
jgi:hypothetical protein